jgi:hypothetical protein
MTNQDIQHVISGSKYVTLSPQGSETKNSRLNEDPRQFDFIRYAEEIHPAIPVFKEDLNAEKYKQLPRCLDMPLRLAGQEEYRLPTEWEPLKGTLEKVISVEHEHNTSWNDYHTYLTVDTNKVAKGTQQRHAGLHVDGFQGNRIKEKTKVTRNYIATSNGGTLYFPQRFISADPEHFNVFLGFELQADTSALCDENTFYFIDAYTVHESGFAQHNGERLFIRVTYDLKRFDRLGNTHNSSLDYDWEMVKRNIQETLKRPKLTDIVDSPYFPNPS